MADPTVLNPATVNDNPVQAQISTAIRDAGIVIGFVSALLGFVSKHDLAGAINFLQSAQALPAIGMIGAGAIVIWRQIHARRDVAVKVAAVTNPGSVQLKGSSNA